MTEETPRGSAGQGGFSGPSQAPLFLHIPTLHASPPRMPNLAHAICRLSSEIGTGMGAECITSAPDPPALGEEGKDQGPGQAGSERAAARSQLSHLSPVCSSYPNLRCRGSLGKAMTSLAGLQPWGGPMTGAERQALLLFSGLGVSLPGSVTLGRSPCVVESTSV